MSGISLVTGAAGFVGSHLARELSRRGTRVRCLVHHSNHLGRLKNVAAEIITGDLADRQSLKKALDGVETVYHLAACVRPLKTFYSANGYYLALSKDNVDGTKNLADEALGRVANFVFYSSIAAGGVGPDLTEDDPRPALSDYGKTKREAEKYLLGLHKEKNFPVKIIRPASVIGPGNVPMAILFKFIKRGVMPTFGKGENRSPLCYVENLIKATLLVSEKGKPGEIYCMAEGSMTLSEFGGAIARAEGVELSGLYVPKSAVLAGAALKDFTEKILCFRFFPLHMDLGLTTVRCASADWSCRSDKLAALGFKPEVRLEEGIRRTVLWYRENGLL